MDGTFDERPGSPSQDLHVRATMFHRLHERNKCPETGNGSRDEQEPVRPQNPKRPASTKFRRRKFLLSLLIVVVGLSLANKGAAQSGVQKGPGKSFAATRSASTSGDQSRNSVETAARQTRLPKPSIQSPSSVIEQIGPAGLRTFRWDFSRGSDKNFDGWPDGFDRHFASGYPEYVEIDIQARDESFERQILGVDTAMVVRWPKLRRFLSSSSLNLDLPPLPPSIADYVVDRCLQIRLDGGKAKVTTPSLPTKSTFQYYFSVDIKTDRLTHDHVYAEVLFADNDGNQLLSVKTEEVTQTRGWQTVAIDELVPPQGAASMKVAMHVSSGEDGLEDIRGTVSWDNIVFRQFPQMKIQTDHPFGVYRKGDNVTATTQVLGLTNLSVPGDETVDIRLRLLDQDGRELRTVKKSAVTAESSNNSSSIRSPKAAAERPYSTSERTIEVEWSLRGLAPGFYRLTAAMESRRGSSLANETSFVVIDRLTDDDREWSPESDRTASATALQTFGATSAQLDSLPFGWTLPASMVADYQNGQLSDKAIAGWLRDSGVGYVRIPAWLSPNDTEAADAIGNLAFRLKDFQIEPVGLLDEPRESDREHYRLRERGESGVAAYLHEPAVWRSQLDTIMNRMTFRIKKWQLGRDDDFSFQSRRQLTSKVNEIASGLQGFGQPLEVIIPWPWMDVPPKASGESWKGLCRHTDQALTADELDAMLDQESVSNEQMRLSASSTWMTIDPLPRDRYPRDARIADMILRMATVRGHDVDVAFVADPLAPESALVAEDGHPGELMLPWRTASLLLGRTRNIGTLRLRNESMNVVFRGAQSSVLMIWANTPRTERLFLGDGVYQVDVWGRRSEVPTETVDGRPAHRVEVGPLPTFLVKIDPALAQFRMSVAVDQKRIDALLGKEQRVSVRYTNPVGQLLSGTVSLRTPSQWNVVPAEQTMDINPNETAVTDFAVVLGNNATIGHFELPIDFEFATSPPTFIRVYRELDVGPEGFDLLVTTRLIGDSLRVKIEMTNHTSRRANFDCLLFAGSERQYERRILALNPGQTVYRNIDWTDGRNLVGTRMLLRAIEEDGDRVINHSFEVTP